MLIFFMLTFAINDLSFSGFVRYVWDIFCSGGSDKFSEYRFLIRRKFLFFHNYFINSNHSIIWLMK